MKRCELLLVRRLNRFGSPPLGRLNHRFNSLTSACVLACFFAALLQLGAQKAAVQVDLQPLVSLSAALASGKASGSKGSEEKKAAAAACQRVLYTLQSGGRRLWASLAPAVALDASQVLVEYVSEGVLHDVLNKQVGLRAEALQQVLQLFAVI